MINAATTAALLVQDIDSRIGRNTGANNAEATAKEFESMFLSQMMEQMFGDSIGDEAFGDSDSSQIYKGLLMDAYGKEISRAGGIGIAPYIQRELLKLQEVTS